MKKKEGAKNFVAFAGGASLPIDAINVGRGADELLLYTNHFDSHTHTDSSGTEVLLELTRPLVLMPEPAGALATGSYWWKIRFGTQSGWVNESELLRTGGPDRDAGVPPGDGGTIPDAATIDSGITPDGGTPNGGGTGGCDCSASTGADHALLIVALLIGSLWLRRRC